MMLTKVLQDNLLVFEIGHVKSINLRELKIISEEHLGLWKVVNVFHDDEVHVFWAVDFDWEEPIYSWQNALLVIIQVIEELLADIKHLMLLQFVDFL